MKIAITGKGGVGKTTLSALIIRILSKKNKKVLAIDADPDANLASAIGILNSDKIKPISQMKELILERTGAKAGTIGGFFKLNPKVDDIPDSLSVKLDNIKLIKLGGVKKGGGGCICPESTLLKALVMHVVLLRDEFVIMDMEAGIEHLGRATATGVDKLIIVVEPGQRSIDTALNIKKLASEISVKNIAIVGNKIRNQKDKEFLKTRLADFQFLGFIPYDNQLIEADLNSTASYDTNSEAKIKVEEIVENLL